MLITQLPIKPKLQRVLNVAAYARVSTAKDAMLHSLAAQVSYYSTLIQNHPGWHYVGVYADEATTGTKDNREAFQRLINDCRNGKVDMVLTKSVSRFARNTVDSLRVIRELKALGVDVYFEEQHIHTLSGDGELMLTLLSAFAQEESRSASENQKWRIRKGFQNGEIMNLRMMYGYRISKCGGVSKRDRGGMRTKKANCDQAEGNQPSNRSPAANDSDRSESDRSESDRSENQTPSTRITIEIDPKQAAIVREMYKRVIDGESLSSIARWLNREGHRGVMGGKWSVAMVHAAIRNEKYTGNALLQKHYRNNHIEKKRTVNCGELPMYYVTESHPAIIDEETYKKAQEVLAGRSGEGTSHSKQRSAKESHLFTGLIICGKCGRPFKHTRNHGRSRWACPTYLEEGKAACECKQIPEEVLVETCREMVCGGTIGSSQADINGSDRIDRSVLTKAIDHITAIYPNSLVFHFKDGRELRTEWQSKSRSGSWTPEMKQQAGNDAKKRWTVPA